MKELLKKLEEHNITLAEDGINLLRNGHLIEHYSANGIELSEDEKCLVDKYTQLI